MLLNEFFLLRREAIKGRETWATALSRARLDFLRKGRDFALGLWGGLLVLVGDPIDKRQDRRHHKDLLVLRKLLISLKERELLAWRRACGADPRDHGVRRVRIGHRGKWRVRVEIVLLDLAEILLSAGRRR